MMASCSQGFKHGGSSQQCGDRVPYLFTTGKSKMTRVNSYSILLSVILLLMCAACLAKPSKMKSNEEASEVIKIRMPGAEPLVVGLYTRTIKHVKFSSVVGYAFQIDIYKLSLSQFPNLIYRNKSVVKLFHFVRRECAICIGLHLEYS